MRRLHIICKDSKYGSWDGSDTVLMCPDEAIAYYLQGFQMVPGMVPDGSDTALMCPDEANAYYLQGFQIWFRHNSDVPR